MSTCSHSAEESSPGFSQIAFDNGIRLLELSETSRSLEDSLLDMTRAYAAVANRGVPGADAAVGFFANTVPLRIRVGRDAGGRGRLAVDVDMITVAAGQTGRGSFGLQVKHFQTIFCFCALRFSFYQKQRFCWVIYQVV